MSPVVVHKYGGTSVANPARIRRACRRIAEAARDGSSVVAVVSAMGHTTDRLIRLARDIVADPPARELDMLVANGETITAPLVAMCLHEMGVPAISLSGLQAGVRTSSQHSRARIREIDTERLLAELARGRVCIVAGFQGVSIDGELTTLGRGGSDTTAVALAAALGAEQCEIFTDVEGICTADPRVVPSARVHRHIAYDEMLELASVGAQVMHPRAVEIGQLYGIGIHVRSSFGRGPGTMIVPQVPMEDRKRVRGVVHEDGVAKVTVLGVPDQPGIAATVFEPLGAASVPVDVIVQNVSVTGTSDITFTLASRELPVAVPLVEAAAARVGAREVISSSGLAKVSIVGSGMLGTAGIASQMFRTLADAGINIEAISTSEIRVTCLVDSAHAADGVRALHQAFELDRP